MTSDLQMAIGKSRLDSGLLVLRLGAGLSLLVGYGLPRLEDAAMSAFAGHAWSFAEGTRGLGLPAPLLVACYQTLNESVAALLVALGVLSRCAAVSLGLGFLAATYVSIVTEQGEAWTVSASFYCLIFTTLALTGPGRYSIDGLFNLGQRERTLEAK